LSVRNSATKVMTVPGSSVTRKISAVVFSCRSGRSPELGVMEAMRDKPRSGQNRPEPTMR
jgi:hypothetical protein